MVSVLHPLRFSKGCWTAAMFSEGHFIPAKFSKDHQTPWMVSTQAYCLTPRAFPSVLLVQRCFQWAVLLPQRFVRDIITNNIYRGQLLPQLFTRVVFSHGIFLGFLLARISKTKA